MRISNSDPLAARATSAAKKPPRISNHGLTPNEFWAKVEAAKQPELELEPWPSAELQVAQDAAKEFGPRTLSFVLPYPPGVNTLYGHRVIPIKGKPTAVPYKTHEHRDYMEAAGVALLGLLPFKADVLLVVTLKLFRPRRAGDIDGPLKTLFDALNGRAWADDSQVVELHVTRGDDKHAPRVEVSITAAPTQE